ncbi:hypothetical protein [Mycobacterium ostraviense]|nr:hypothetical protein [Mycobacterium ostraviense]
MSETEATVQASLREIVAADTDTRAYQNPPTVTPAVTAPQPH